MKPKKPPRIHLASTGTYTACGKQCAWNERTKNLRQVTCKPCMGRLRFLTDTLIHNLTIRNSIRNSTMYTPKYIRRAHCTDMNRLNNPPLFGKRPAMCGDDSAAYIMDRAIWVTALPNERCLKCALAITKEQE